MGMQAQHFQKACTVHAQDPPFPFPPSNKTGVRSRAGWSLGSYPSHRQTGFSVTDRYYHTQLEMSNNGYATKKPEFLYHKHKYPTKKAYASYYIKCITFMQATKALVLET